MKRIFNFALAVGAMTLLLSAVVRETNRGGRFARPVQEAKPNTDITPEMMNGGAAFFKTYEDFINQTGKLWIYLGDDLKREKNHITGYEMVFKDEAGKKINVSTADFWGYRDKTGLVYRNGDFIYKGIKKVPFQITYIAKDFIYYQPRPIEFTFTVDPGEWCSASINSEIKAKDEFFKDHSNENFKQIKRDGLACDKEIPFKQSYATDIKGLVKYYEQISYCHLKNTNVLCIWTITSFNKMRTAGYGSYFFSKAK
jgi:hypothetical protein